MKHSQINTDVTAIRRAYGQFLRRGLFPRASSRISSSDPGNVAWLSACPIDRIREVGRVDETDLRVSVEPAREPDQSGDPVMENLHHQLTGSGSVVLLCSGDGLILHSMGDPDFLPEGAARRAQARRLLGREAEGHQRDRHRHRRTRTGRDLRRTPLHPAESFPGVFRDSGARSARRRGRCPRHHLRLPLSPAPHASRWCRCRCGSSKDRCSSIVSPRCGFQRAPGTELSRQSVRRAGGVFSRTVLIWRQRRRLADSSSCGRASFRGTFDELFDAHFRADSATIAHRLAVNDTGEAAHNGVPVFLQLGAAHRVRDSVPGRRVEPSFRAETANRLRGPACTGDSRSMRWAPPIR